MGTVLSTISGADEDGGGAPNTTSTTTVSAHGFTNAETEYLLSLRRLVCQERHMLQQETQQGDVQSIIPLVWRCSHQLAALNDTTCGTVALIQQRLQQLEVICNDSSLNNSLSDALQRIFTSDNKNEHESETYESYLEFVSSMLWRNGSGYSQSIILQFIWIVCSETNACSGDGVVLAERIVELCLCTAMLVHYMLKDDAFAIDNGSMTLVEARSDAKEKMTIQSLTASLLEYTASTRADQFGGYAATTDSTTVMPKGSVTQREFSEWQRKVVPDLVSCSIVQFFQVLFFPPDSNDVQQQKQPQGVSNIFQQYTMPFPALHSSKEVISQTTRLGEGEVIPISSPVFGSNVRGENSNNPSTSFSPSVYAFTSISISRFGGKVR